MEFLLSNRRLIFFYIQSTWSVDARVTFFIYLFVLFYFFTTYKRYCYFLDDLNNFFNDFFYRTNALESIYKILFLWTLKYSKKCSSGSEVMTLRTVLNIWLTELRNRNYSGKELWKETWFLSTATVKSVDILNCIYQTYIDSTSLAATCEPKEIWTSGDSFLFIVWDPIQSLRDYFKL